MRFTESRLKGAFIIELDRIEDERGFFARSFCQKEFVRYGLETNVSQCNISFNKMKGTIRGMHFQRKPKGEPKLVRCTAGRIYDIIIDLRRDSRTYCEWEAVELTADNRKALYIPKGFAHGFQTLEDNTEVFYQMYEFYYPEYSSGARWNDPKFSIKWPLPPVEISEKDSGYPDYKR
ncbi:MAG: dTDP-4-dehydrorhamnose 3,5-epimerase [Proteobacteria bacterium]|nr:dTDP-4-dehydrorhamnose 3,5-epimerase [Pseudomonadota bacterium]